MGKDEQETNIIWTMADLEEGYFNFYTSIKSDYDKLLKRIGGAEKLIDSTVYRTADGAFSGVQCKVPASYLCRGSFSVRSAGRLAADLAQKASGKGNADRLKPFQFPKKQNAVIK